MKLFNDAVNQDDRCSTSIPNLSQSSMEGASGPSRSDLKKENADCKERLGMMQEAFNRLQYISIVVRRCSSCVMALTSVPMGSVNGDLLET